MKQRLDAALQGDLTRFMAEELRAAEIAVTAGITEVAGDLKEDLRADVIAGGLGRRLSRSWRHETYPKGGTSLGAAASVFTKAPQLIDAFERGVTIRSGSGLWLAIPTRFAPARGMGRKRLTPSNFPEHRFGPLRFVYRPTGPSLLVVDDMRRSRGKRGGFVRSRAKKPRRTTTVPMFFLVRQARLKRRLRVREIADDHGARIAAAIDRAFNRQSGQQR